MSRARHHATQWLAAAALAAIPTLALAQAAAQPNPAAEQLAAARTALNKVLNAPVPPGNMFKSMTDLKTEYLLLERAASTASPDWFAHYTMIDRLIGGMLGPSPITSEPGAVGTSGRTGSPTGRVEAGVAADLQDFRTHLMKFSAAMSAISPGGVPPSEPAPAPPATAPRVDTLAAPSAAADAGALVDQVTALVDGALGVGAPASDTISVDRAVLEKIRKQLEQIKQRMSTP